MTNQGTTNSGMKSTRNKSGANGSHGREEIGKNLTDSGMKSTRNKSGANGSHGREEIGKNLTNGKKDLLGHQQKSLLSKVTD